MNGRKRKTMTVGREVIPADTPKRSKTLQDNFTQGDILFGLQEEKTEVADELRKKGFHHIYAKDVNCPVVRYIVKDQINEETISGLDKEQKEHLTFLQRHKEYIVKKPGKPLPKTADPDVGSGIRRGCKLLLIHRSQERTSKAHVMTKGIMWKQVCSKEDDGVTNSEMRAAYRDFKKNGKNPHIFFYDQHNKQMNQTPWELPQFKSHWDRYDKLRQAKKDKSVESSAGQPISHKKP